MVHPEVWIFIRCSGRPREYQVEELKMPITLSLKQLNSIRDGTGRVLHVDTDKGTENATVTRDGDILTLHPPEGFTFAIVKNI